MAGLSLNRRMVLVHAGHRLRAALVVAVVLELLVTAASPVHAERLPTRRYTTADGLPHDHVTCVVQDSHGFVWFFTAGGNRGTMQVPQPRLQSAKRAS